MVEKAGVHTKAQESKQKCSNSCKRKSSDNSSGSPADRVLQLQKTAGNLAVQSLIKSRVLQAKLRVGQPNDIYEQEADRVAEQVMRMPELHVVSNGTVSNGTSSVQRTCPRCEKEKLRRQSIIDEEEKEKLLQTKGISEQNAETKPDLESRINAIRGGGQPLAESERAFFEPRFGYDFSSVRVHTDSDAARRVNAQAFTIGQDVVFGAGEYAPRTREGQKLLAHELTHVIQQRQAFKNPNAPSIQRKVFRCCREVETGEKVLDIISGIFDLEHCWLKTDTKEAGMGPAQEGPLPSWPFGIPTKINDHSKETSKNCSEISSIDEDCVNQELEIGRSTGKWGPRNNCNTFADNIIDMCRKRRAEHDRRIVRSGTLGIELVNGASLVNLAAENQPYFEVRPLPPQHSLGFRWIIADDQDRRYFMWGDQGQVFYYGAQYRAYIPPKTRALLRERNIREATILCRVIGGGIEQLMRLPIRFVW